MSDRDALMAAIVQNPDDDTPRLVFADWLDEHDEPDRAAFIRLQCEAARLPRGAEKEQLDAAADALLERRRREWLTPLGPGFRRALFERGFVEDVTMTARAFLRHAGRVMSRTPLRKVAISEAGDHIPGLAASPHLGRVAHLELRSGRIDSRAAQTLAESPYLRQVESLDLKYNSIRAAGVRAVLDATAGAGRGGSSSART